MGRRNESSLQNSKSCMKILPPPGRGAHFPHPFWRWTVLCDSLPKTEEAEGWTVEKPGQYHLKQVIQAHIASDATWISCATHTMGWDRHVTFVVFFPATHNPTLIMRKIWDKPNLKDTLESAWSVLPKAVEVMINKELRNYHGDEGDMTATCTVVSWPGSWNFKRIFVENLAKSK